MRGEMKAGMVIVGEMTLAGCTISTATMDDYSAADAAKLRVENYATPLVAEIYQQSGSCLRQVDQKSLTSAVNILGIKSTRNKKIAGIAPLPASSPLQGKDVMEFSVKPGQFLRIGYVTVSQTTYSQTVHESFRSVSPKAGHSYEVYTLPGGYYTHEIMITDVTEGKDIPAPVWALNECPYDYNLFHTKVYR